MTRLFAITCLAAALSLPLGAQSNADQAAAQGFGPVTVAAGEKVNVCVANMGNGNARSTVEIFNIASGAVNFVTKYEPSLASGKSACYEYAAKSNMHVFVVLAGDPKAGWDISERNLMVSAEVLDSGGKMRLALSPLPKLVSTKLLQK